MSSHLLLAFQEVFSEILESQVQQDVVVIRPSLGRMTSLHDPAYAPHVDVSDLPPSSYIVYGRLIVFAVSLLLWLYLWSQKTDLGRDVFGYHGDNKYLMFRRQAGLYSWWWQSSLILLSFTWHNNLLIDSLTILATIPLGGPIYDEYPKMRSLFHLSSHNGWDYLFSLLFNIPHHTGVSYMILFESDSNKTLYRPIFFWLWLCHPLRQVQLKYASIIAPYISMDLVWKIYWKIAPYLLGYWYIFDFMQSDNEFMSIGLLLLLFGRWGLCFNWPDDAKWPIKQRWREETILSIVHLVLAYVYCHGVQISWLIATVYALLVAGLQHVPDPDGSENYNWRD